MTLDALKKQQKIRWNEKRVEKEEEKLHVAMHFQTTVMDIK